MPVLPREPSSCPLDLLAEEEISPCFADSTRAWQVVHTRSRQEKSVARELFKYQVPFYLPLISSARVLKGRRIQSFLPLFPGYLFLFGTEDERLVTVKTNRISAILPVDDQVQLRTNLIQVNRLIASDAPLSLERRLQPGQRTRIKSGPFRGVEGTLIRREGKQRFLVAVNFLAQGISMLIDDVLLEPIESCTN